MLLRLGELKQGTRSNHPRIDRDAPRLQADVERARETAHSDPPNSFFAGVVYQSCAYCHEVPDQVRERGVIDPRSGAGPES